METGFFELNSWGLSGPEIRSYARAAFFHEAFALEALGRPPLWPSTIVDPCHLFACGTTRGGGMVAARRALEILLEHGAQLDAVDSTGWTPLAYAAWFGLPSTLDILLEAGANVHPEGASLPLTVALSSVAQRNLSGSETCARLLIMCGAQPLRCSISEATGRASFLSWALSKDDLPWATLLASKGDRLRNDREISVLTWQAGPEALDWMQINGYNVLSRLPPDHAHLSELMKAEASRRREALTAVAAPLRAALDNESETQQDDSREL